MKPYLRSSLSALILLGGCAAVGPDYAPPSASAPASFGAMPAGIDGSGVEIEWWRGFDEPALESLIQRALAANLDIALAGARLDEAKALLRENREEFLPRGGPAFDYQARRRGEVETPAGQQRDIETYRGALDASWEIDLFGRVRRSVEAAEAQAGSREALLRNVQASVAATVAMSWFQLQGIEAELAVVHDIAGNQRDSLEMVERLVSAGSAHEFDRLRAEALLHNVEAAVPDLERRRAATRNALAVLSRKPAGLQPAGRPCLRGKADAPHPRGRRPGGTAGASRRHRRGRTQPGGRDRTYRRRDRGAVSAGRGTRLDRPGRRQSRCFGREWYVLQRPEPGDSLGVTRPRSRVGADRRQRSPCAGGIDPLRPDGTARPAGDR